jgi:hypothetical protein
VSSDSISVMVAIPRDQLPSAAPPDFYSQENCAGLGLTHRAFLELLQRPGAPKAAKVGKLRLVPRAEVLAFIDALRSKTTIGAAPLDEADAVLVQLGCVPTRKTG